MPELPEVETVRRGLNLVTLKQTIEAGDVVLDRVIASPSSATEFLAGLKGTQIAQWHRRGKYLLAELIRSGPEVEPAGWLGVHLRMTGQMLWLEEAQPLQKHARVRLFFANNRELRFVDQRSFGRMWWVPPALSPEAIMSGLQKLGPEPFSSDFSVEYLAEKLRDRRRPIKSALLDQWLVAGVGNIYADEALFLSRVHPAMLCTELTLEQIQRLHAALIQVLNASIEVGGTTFSTFVNVQGINGNYGGKAQVYAREGKACEVCTTPIQRLKLAGRSAHFCPNCQS